MPCAPVVARAHGGEAYTLDASWWKSVIGHQEIADAAGLAEGQEMTRIGLESPRSSSDSVGGSHSVPTASVHLHDLVQAIVR